MTRKTLAIALLFIFLSACAPVPQTLEVLDTSEVLTSTATSTFTPEPTATNTPIPTATPYPYSSCLDLDLQQEMINAFPEDSGTDLSMQEQFQIVRESDNYSARGFTIGVMSNGTRPETLMYIGYSVVQAGNIKVACANFISSRDPNTMIPVALGFEHDGVFKELITLSDCRFRGENDVRYYQNYSVRVDLQSLPQLIDWMNDSGVRPGDIFILNGNVLSNINNLEEFSKLNPNLHWNLSAQIQFLQLTGNESYLERHKGRTFKEIATSLSLENGDVAILAAFLYWFGSAEN